MTIAVAPVSAIACNVSNTSLLRFCVVFVPYMLRATAAIEFDARFWVEDDVLDATIVISSSSVGTTEVI